MTTNKEDVAKFLKNAKSLISNGDVFIAKRTTNLQDIVEIGLSMDGVKQELLDLSVEDYSKGPEPDRDFPGEVWVFGKEILGHEVYIKIKIDQRAKHKKVTCISFHIAKYELENPLKDNDK